MWACICASQPLTIACWRPRCCHLTSGVAWRYKPGIFGGSPLALKHTHRNPVHALHTQAIVALDRGTTKAPKGLYALSLDLPLPTAAALSAFAPEDQVSAALAHGEAGMRTILEAMSQYMNSSVPVMPLWLTTTTPRDPVRDNVWVALLLLKEGQTSVYLFLFFVIAFVCLFGYVGIRVRLIAFV